MKIEDQIMRYACCYREQVTFRPTQLIAGVTILSNLCGYMLLPLCRNKHDSQNLFGYGEQ